MEENKDKYIVIKEVIQKKNPKLLKWMPNFVLNYIRRVAHEEDINKVMAKNGHLYGLEFVDALITYLGVKVKLVGEENIPSEGGVIFASNHPLGGLDGVAFMHVVGSYRKDIKFIVNDILLNIKNLEPLFVGVNKHGAQARKASLMIEEAYKKDNALLVFPAGLVSRKQKQGIKDLEWKKSFITQAKKYKRDIVPVFIDGKNSNFFYNFANFRKKIGIKSNIEMFYLSDEMFSQKDKTVTIYIGKPVSYTHFDNTKSEREWAAYMKNKSYNLSPKS